MDKKIVSNLAGKLLLAMPNMSDPRFYRSAIFMCTHDEDGAMGLIINHALLNLTLGQLMEQLKVPTTQHPLLATPVLAGGPVESGRGFIIHTPDFNQPETMHINSHFSVTGTVDALQLVGAGLGPKELVFVLGYAGWTAGQLEAEIQENAWMVAEADHEIIFNTPIEQKWDRAMGRIGVDPGMLSTTSGHA